MLLFALSLDAWAACPSDAASLAAALERAEAAFVKMDAPVFNSASTEALSDAECLSGTLTPALAARLHRVRGLSDFVNGDESGAKRAFAAARAIEPEWRYAVANLPANHPVRTLYDASAALAPAPEPLPQPAQGRLELDGRVATERPTSWPTVAVLVAPDGAVKASAYLDPGEPIFAYPLPAPVSTVEPTPIRPGPRRGLQLAVVSGLSLAAAGGLYLAASGPEERFNDLTIVDPDDLAALRKKTNGLVYGSLGLATVGLGAGVGAVLVGSW